jgi:hypothetical protein
VEESEWWALAQHNGMATSLLDWSESSFVALYFAFEKESNGTPTERAVWGLGGINRKNTEIRRAHIGEDRPPTLDLIRPMQDENSRLVNQAGLFTRLPLGKTVEQWVGENFRGKIVGGNLIKICMPNKGRDECLRTLNRMNINHLSLFPDLYGAGKHCNHALQISKYSA